MPIPSNRASLLLAKRVKTWSKTDYLFKKHRHTRLVDSVKNSPNTARYAVGSNKFKYVKKRFSFIKTFALKIV